MGLQAATGSVLVETLTEAKCKKSGEKLNDDETAANADQHIFVVFEIVD